MKIIRLVFLGVICWAVLPLHVAGQNKQGNTTSSEVYADIPWTMIKLDASGKPNSIPVHFYVHDADVLGGTEQLMSITIQIKNATDLNYGPAIRFDTMPINSFRSLFSAKSVANTDLDVQAFDPTAFITSNSVTIDFISDTTSWPFTTYEEITGHIWFFTFNIPSSVLENYDSDIIDFRVYCELDWATDYETELRVFRTNEFPAIPNGWYRGDTHHHCIMTQNTAENGFDLPGTHDAAKLTGLSWITITDHSCDYDNYGVSMQGNWDILGDMVAEVNNSDTTFNFIRGMEVSVANSKGNTVHALIYPPSSNPFGMPYVADGRGDETQGPGVSVPMLLDSMGKYGGFCYAAHPYAEGDVLSIIVSGDVWNLSDPGFPANGQPHPSGGSVVCNDTTQDSDLLSSEPGYFMKNYLLGGEILNEYISMGTTDDPDNPWNTTGDGSVTPFAPLALTDDYHHTRRFKQNLDLVEFVWKKAMHARNTDDNIQNWKYHISAGSDAHGSYNFNNTDQFMGVYGIINDNAVGKLSTLVYCPNGMGVNGTGVLDALRSGHNVLSSGPILTMHIDSDGNPATAEVLPGDDIEIVYEDLLNYNVWFNAQTADLYGDITDIQLIAGSENTVVSMSLPLFSGEFELNLKTIIDTLRLLGIPTGQYIYLRAELHTVKDFGADSVFALRRFDYQYSYTNPIWMKADNPVGFKQSNIRLDDIRIFPNPAKSVIHIQNPPPANLPFSINTLQGEIVASGIATNTIDISNLPDGMYIICFGDKLNTKYQKFVKASSE